MLMIQEAPAQGSVSDPARQIGGWVSYNVRYTNTLRPGSTINKLPVVLKPSLIDLNAERPTRGKRKQPERLSEMASDRKMR